MKTGRFCSLQPSGAARSAVTGRGRALAHTALALVMAAAVASCSSTLKEFSGYDINRDISKEKYKELLNREPPAPQQRGAEPPIPDFQSVLAAPTAPELADTRRVSIAVTESVPVRDLLIELARKAQVDLELDPRISGGVIMTATDRPFIDVVARIADLAELRYKFERNTLKVEIDDPYLEQYRMDMLNIRRNASSSAGSTTDAASSAQAIGGGGGAQGNKSASNIDSSTTSDFWREIGDNIEQLLAEIQTRRGKAATTEDGATFVPEAQKAATASAPAAGAAGAPAGGAGGAAAGLVGAAAGLGAGRQAQLDANLALANGDAQQAAGPTLKLGGTSAGPQSNASRYSLNPAAGIITVFANQRQQKAIERYLRDVRASVTQQVLIEAKVMEITLNDQFRSGIDWTSVFGPHSGLQNFNFATGFGQNVASDLLSPTVSGTWTGAIFNRDADGVGRNDLSVATQLVSRFGTARTLSSPRLTVLNNQMAQLKVAANQVFFQLQVNITPGTAQTPAQTTVQSQIRTVPVGLIMNVQPAVDPTTRRISLNLRPSITRITGYVNDPGVAISVAVAQQSSNGGNIPTVTSPIPIIEAREMDSVVNMESGQTLVMGGLMQEQANNAREGIPGLADIPFIGRLAGSNSRTNSVSELVVFIRATLVNAPGTVTDEDIRLYRTFTPDARRVAF